MVRRRLHVRGAYLRGRSLSVANIPTTSVTGATTAGQGGSTAAAVNTSSLLYIALSFGFSLAVNAWIFFRVSGGLFNPAVSLGMALVGALHWTRACLLVVSQILGGIVGAAIIQAITPGTLNVRTTLGGGTSVVQGLFIEMFLTSMLMLAMWVLQDNPTSNAPPTEPTKLLVSCSPPKRQRQPSLRPSVSDLHSSLPSSWVSTTPVVRSIP